MKRMILMATLFLSACASTDDTRRVAEEANPYFHSSPVHFFPGVSESTRNEVQSTLEKVLSERADLQEIEDPTYLSSHVIPEEGGAYRVSISVTTSGPTGLKPKSRSTSFVIKPGHHLEPELKRQIGILLPPPKRAKAQVNDLTPEEVHEGYDRLHKRLHKRK